MNEFWESHFINEGTSWGFEPSDSALFALEYFKKNEIKDILIPGIGYGRNAKLFLDSGFNVTGIEISKSAIELASKNGLDCKIRHGSVTSMPFDEKLYDGIFCYALIHLLNKPQRRILLKCCHNQLKIGGIMIFTVISKNENMYGTGKRISKDRYKLKSGLQVFFYDIDSARKEFGDFEITELREIDEPIKFMSGLPALKCILITCKKN